MTLTTQYYTLHTTHYTLHTQNSQLPYTTQPVPQNPQPATTLHFHPSPERLRSLRHSQGIRHLRNRRRHHHFRP